MILETIYANGHPNIQCTHTTTIEITKDTFLTKKGTCILGINSSKSCKDLNKNLKQLLKQNNKFKITIEHEGYNDYFYGYGNPKLTLLDSKDMVFRKSNYTCDRTVLIFCTKSSNELNRELIYKIKDKKKKFSIIFERAEDNEK